MSAPLEIYADFFVWDDTQENDLVMLELIQEGLIKALQDVNKKIMNAHFVKVKKNEPSHML